MNALRAAKIPGEMNTHRESELLTSPRTKVLSSTECPSCFRKGTMEVFIRNHGEYTFCYSCGYREINFYR